MQTQIALLRGINVAGQKIIPMADLKALFVKLGFKDAKTFIQSGNVVFTSSKTTGVVRKVLEDGIRKRFAMEVTVIVKTLAELERIVKSNPYVKPAAGERVYLTYLAEAPGKEGVKALEGARNGVDDFTISRDAVYILVRGGYGKSQFSNLFVEKRLAVRATSRNLESSLKLITLARTLGE